MDIKERVLVVYPVSLDVNFHDYRDEIHPPTADITYLIEDFPVKIDIKSIVGVHLRTDGDINYHFRAWIEDSTGKRVDLDRENPAMDSGTVYFDMFCYKEYISYLMDVTLRDITFSIPGIYQIIIEIYPGSLSENPDSKNPIHRNSAFVFIAKKEEDSEVING